MTTGGRRIRAFVLFSGGTALLAAAAAVAFRDDPSLVGPLVAASLVAASSATMLCGAPYAGPGRPSPFRLAMLAAMAAVGVAFAIAVDLTAVVGALAALNGFVGLVRRPRPAAARADRDPPTPRRVAVGLAVIALVVLAGFVASVALVVEVTGPGAARILLMGVLAVVTTQVAFRLGLLVVGRRIRRVR